MSEDERFWAFLAWLLSIAGAILAMLLRPNYRYAKYWAHLSISFFIVAIALGVVSSVVSDLPVVGTIVSAVVTLCLVMVWILGIVKVLHTEWWKPPLVYDVAKAIGIERV